MGVGCYTVAVADRWTARFSKCDSDRDSCLTSLLPLIGPYSCAGESNGF